MRTKLGKKIKLTVVHWHLISPEILNNTQPQAAVHSHTECTTQKKKKNKKNRRVQGEIRKIRASKERYVCMPRRQGVAMKANKKWKDRERVWIDRKKRQRNISFVYPKLGSGLEANDDRDRQNDRETYRQTNSQPTALLTYPLSGFKYLSISLSFCVWFLSVSCESENSLNSR